MLRLKANPVWTGTFAAKDGNSPEKWLMIFNFILSDELEIRTWEAMNSTHQPVITSSGNNGKCVQTGHPWSCHISHTIRHMVIIILSGAKNKSERHFGHCLGRRSHRSNEWYPLHGQCSFIHKDGHRQGLISLFWEPITSLQLSISKRLAWHVNALGLFSVHQWAGPGQTILSLSSAQIDRAEIHRTTGAGLKLKHFEAPQKKKTCPKYRRPVSRSPSSELIPCTPSWPPDLNEWKWRFPFRICYSPAIKEIS